MEYQVPQFIEVEDKIVGPLTLKQFIYLAGGAGLCIVFLFYLPLIFGVLFALPVGAFAVALAFYKVNGKPFIEVLESAVSYYTGAKLFIWKREDKKLPPSPTSVELLHQKDLKNLSLGHSLTSNKLQQLAWSLDVQNNQKK